MDRVDENRRVGRISDPVGRRGRKVLGEKAARGRDRLLHVAGIAGDVCAQVELQRDRCRPEPARRGHRGEPGNSGELVFERRRHSRRHHSRARARERCRHRDRRELDVGQRGDRQQREADRAERKKTRRHQRGRDRPADEDFRDIHGEPLAAALGGSIATFTPLARLYWPLTTIRSPAETPLVNTANPFWRATTSTGTRWATL